MLQERDFFRDSSTLIFSTLRRLITNRLLLKSDIARITLTIFEQDSPLSNTGTPVPYFEEIEMDIDSVVWDTLQDGELEDRFGVRPIQFNFAHILAPIDAVIDGTETKLYPFPTIGRCYRVMYFFRTVDPDIPNFTLPVVGYAV